MSKIEKELCDAAEVDPKRGESRGDFLLRLALATNALSDKEWDKLSQPAQDWVNKASDAVNDKKSVPDFPDAEAPASSGRRRVSEEKEVADKPFEPKLKDDVKILTKRGKTVTGKIVEMDKEVIILQNIDGGDEEVSRDRIEKIEPLVGGSGKSADREDDGPRDPKVGDTLTVTTKRGKVATGEVTELTDELIVLKVNGAEEEFDRDRVESIKIEGGGRRSSRGDSDSKEGKKEDKPADGGRTRSTNAGVSVGTRIRELICDDLKASQEDIGKALKKEGLEFRENTLQLNYQDVHKTLDILRKRGLLKG
jgi:hypothetical protein